MMATYRFIYKSSHTLNLGVGHVDRNFKYSGPQSFPFCPYCKTKLTRLEAYTRNSGPDLSCVEPEVCMRCGWWNIKSSYSDPSHAYEQHTQTIAELAKYDIAGLRIPTKVLIEYLNLHFEDIYLIAPRKLEMIVESVYREHLNCRVELTASTRDGGKDLVCIDAEDQKFIVEVKRYDRKRKVGIGIIQRFSGVLLSEGVSRGIVVTTSDYTRDALVTTKKIVGNESALITLELKSEKDILAWLKVLNEQYISTRGVESSSFLGLSLPPYCLLPESLRNAVLGRK